MTEHHRRLAGEAGVTVNYAVADCDAYAWPDVGSKLAGERAANIISLIESARLNGHDP